MYTRPALDLLYFEDLPLGGEWLTRRRTLTETDLALYRGLAADLNPLHSDHEHAARSPIGLSLPGPLLGAVAVGLGSVDVPVPATVALVGMTWKFTKPVRIGESIAARWRLNRKRDVENPRWGLATWQVDIIGSDGEVKATGEVSRIIARRSSAAAVSTDGDQPARRGRRRGRRSSASSSAPPPPVVEIPEPTPADTPPPARRRRRRRGGGNGNGSHAAEASPPAPEPEPASVQEAGPPAAEEGAGIGRVLKRIRRR